MLTELAALALACAPDIHPATLHAVVKHESRAQQYAIGVNCKGHQLQRQPRSLEEATAAAQKLIDQGIDFDAGLGQINVRNWAWLRLDTTTVFDPCKNLTAAQTVLADCYARALPTHQNLQQALRAALSCYNTGNFRRGFTNGYVGKVLAKAGIKVPALVPLTDATAPRPAADTQTQSSEKPKPKPQSEAPLSAPDGFTSNPATDGFQRPATDQPASGSL